MFACPDHPDFFPLWRPGFERLLADDVSDASMHLQHLAKRLFRMQSPTTGELGPIIDEAQALLVLDATEVEVTPAPRATVDLHLKRWSPTFAQLEATFGPADASPPPGAEASGVYAWQQRLAVAPHRVAIFARFHTAPQSRSRPFAVLLRIEPS